MMPRSSAVLAAATTLCIEPLKACITVGAILQHTGNDRFKHSQLPVPQGGMMPLQHRSHRQNYQSICVLEWWR